MTYRSTARFEDGREITVTGTILECVAWSENVIGCHQGPIEIQIVREAGNDQEGENIIPIEEKMPHKVCPGCGETGGVIETGEELAMD